MIAIKVAEQVILRLVTCPDDSVLADKESQKQAVTVEAFNPQVNRNEFFEITNLHHEQDCWNADHLAGLILTETGFAPVIFLNIESEADVLNLK